jgi:RNA polymerase sigma factor (sigma-70 family)
VVAAGAREVLAADVPEPAAGPDHADPRAHLDAVLTALRALPRRQQVAVVLRHYCDLSEAETAQVMGITVGGVKSQTSKGLATLRGVMAPVPMDEEPTR